jgi:hypothetical protein
LGGRLEIDHIFLFVAPAGPEAERLGHVGLRESYRRVHPGQGTANVCYCFDNAYLELLWATDRREIASPDIARTRLAERADWRRNGACPFGIAVRGEVSLPFATWGYRAPYLPDGMAIPVALSVDDPFQPFLFRSPGNCRPDKWADGRAGNRQRISGLAEIIELEFWFPGGRQPSPDLQALETLGLLALRYGGAGYRMTLTLSRTAGGPHRRLQLPAATLI